MVYSLGFISFLAVTILLYYTVFSRHQWVLLLLASIIFYLANDWKYAVFMLITIVFTFFGAKKISKINDIQKSAIKENKESWSSEEKKNYKTQMKRKRLIITSVIVIIMFSMLMLFKSTKFMPGFSLILPLGISFYTFQSVGYLVDVYRSRCQEEKSFFKYCLFVTYFPQIIEGPINRFEELSHQFFEDHKFSYRVIRNGVWLFLWGLFKKLVIADRAAMFVNGVLRGDELPSGVLCMMAVFIFNIQLYADFSGGIDMVRGVSEMFGITLAENFRQPFFARTIPDYWHRWHMSLSNWIRDYVFYPLAFSKPYAKLSKKLSEKNAHLGKTIPSGIVSVITFLLIGLWHDLSLAYVAYGLWHGMLMAGSEIFKPVFVKIDEFFGYDPDCFANRMAGRIRTWILISIGEIFTILGTFHGSMEVFGRIFSREFKYYNLFVEFFEYGLDAKDSIVLAIAVLLWIAVSIKKESGIRIRSAIELQPLWFRYMATAGIFFAILVFGIYGPGYDAAAFIYEGF